MPGGKADRARLLARIHITTTPDTRNTPWTFAPPTPAKLESRWRSPPSSSRDRANRRPVMQGIQINPMITNVMPLAEINNAFELMTVSYTHLTLPTIYSV